MSDPQAAPDPNREVDATGVDADIVTNDHDPEPDDLPEAKNDEDDDSVEVSDLP
ncbi:hypothetical protein [Microbacterium sp. W4I20]|uniref:hypothetical protein n=1 Tax=Microbacterium sp. W4I20 TaxID=3042262 RepID=UPI002784A9DC|nr:hypothetical protein [Microbacterium sp. W4I20]MDQ0726346.1 hypothetical protein [Microbacterium sp. W4I20]